MAVELFRRLALAVTIGVAELALSSCDDADSPAEETGD
jgi:hypothetical protein